MQDGQIEPKLEDIAQDTGIALNDIICALDAISDTISLDEPVYNDGDDAILISDQIVSTDGSSEYDKLDLRQALDALPKRENQILLMRYFLGKTQIEISEEIGISQAQVSRLEKNALHSMKKLLS